MIICLFNSLLKSLLTVIKVGNDIGQFTFTSCLTYLLTVIKVGNDIGPLPSCLTSFHCGKGNQMIICLFTSCLIALFTVRMVSKRLFVCLFAVWNLFWLSLRLSKWSFVCLLPAWHLFDLVKVRNGRFSVYFLSDISFDSE